MFFKVRNISILIVLTLKNIEGGPQNLRQLNCSFTTTSSHFFAIYISFMKTKFRRSFLGAEQVCILIGSWIMTQNANISVSGIYRFCKKCCNQIFSIHHGWIVPLYYVNKTISTNNWVNFWISIIKQLWDLAPENFVNIQGSYGILDQ